MEDLRRITLDSCTTEKERLSLWLLFAIPFLTLSFLLLGLSIVQNHMILSLLSLALIGISGLFLLDIWSSILKLEYKIADINSNSSETK